MINVQIKNNTQPLTDGVFDAVQLNQADQYDVERLSCEKLRISANIGVICDGTLFNPTTEILTKKTENNETKLEVLYGPFSKEGDKWFTNYGTSNIRFGLDVFNCEFLRMKYTTPMISDDFTKKESYNYYSGETSTIKVGGSGAGVVANQSNFIGLTMTSSDSITSGNTITGYEDTGIPCKYKEGNYYTYYGAVKNKLVRNNGYFGFYNPIFFKIQYDVSDPSESWNTSKYVNSYWEENVSEGYGHVSGARAGEFIEMYPGRKEYSYVPTYNKEKSRMEYNWLTYLTYPSENIILDGYITEYGSLISTFIDDTNGEVITFHTQLKHGLVEGDIINIYSTFNGKSSIKFNNVEVTSVDNAYDFTITTPEKLFEWEYSEVTGQTEFSDTDEISKVYMMADTELSIVWSHSGADTRYLVMSHAIYKRKVSDDDPIYSVKKVENGMECEYYFRKFKSIPTTVSVIKNSFALDTFGVSRANILLDDVDITGIKNNLGCPITDLYLTSVKNNKGYSKWYGYNARDNGDGVYNPNSDEIEASHCFGPINGGFITNSYDKKFDKFDIRYTGRDVGISVLSEKSGVTNEVSENGYEGIGDFCIFSPTTFKETSLQMFMHRFNTAQRDEVGNDTTSPNIALYVTTLSYKVNYGSSDAPKPKYFNILSDTGGVQTEKTSLLDDGYSDIMTNGYYYQPHNKIRVRTFSNDLSYESAVSYKVVTITSATTNVYKYGNLTSSSATWRVATNTPNDFKLNGRASLYFVMPDTSYKQPEPFDGVIRRRYTDSELSFELSNDSRKSELDELIELCNSANMTPTVYLCRQGDTTPSYAKFINDGTLRYVWREVIQNGFDDSSSYEVYPFTNGALYIEPTINIYLRRQRQTNSDLLSGGATIASVLSYPSSENIDDINNKPSSYETVLDQKELESC